MQQPWFTTYCLSYYVNFLEGKKELAALLQLETSKALAENYVTEGPISFLQMGSAMCWKVLSFNMQMTKCMSSGVLHYQIFITGTFFK